MCLRGYNWLAGLLAGLIAISALAQNTPDIGGGAATPQIAQQFIYAWERNGFKRLVGNPLANVAKLGTTGLIQRFPSVDNSNVTLALVMPDPAIGAPDVFQMLAGVYAYYSGLSVATVGYPTSDTIPCPTLLTAADVNNSCQWQPLSNKYAIFVYASPRVGGAQNFSIRDPFYTKWKALGDVGTLGPANGAETAVSSQYGSQGTVQTYDRGAIYSISSGLLSGRLLAVRGAVYDLYISNLAQAGSLGFPSTDELVLSNGMREQSFERGAIRYDPATNVATLRPAISLITLTPSGAIHLNSGDTLAAQVKLSSITGLPITDRAVGWNTSNGQVIQIQANGLTATLRAVGAGTATVTVTAEGNTSQALNISVSAPCCQIGEGAPTAAIQRAFQDAVTSNHLSVQLPAASPATRIGRGYAQQLLSADGAQTPYLVAVPDGSVNGSVVAGGILSQYEALGGPAGALGYPLSDATPGGRQMFQQGALAGNPLQVVSGAILAKWGTLGYETGAAGSPTTPVTTFLTFRGTAGSAQGFQNGLILASSSGALAGQTYFVTGLVVAKYVSSGGVEGDLGAPTGNEQLVGGLRQQDFEGGSISYALGGESAAVTAKPRQAVVTATPASVLAGAQVHLVAGGFNNGATVRVSQTGQPDFLVKIGSGVYVWDVQIPASSAGGSVTVRAVDSASGATAQAVYTVRSAASTPLAVSIVSGDRQTGAPGARLAQPLVVVVLDQNGAPVAGQSVVFTASPGAQVTPASAITGANGQASATLRMPATAGIALATAEAGHQVVTFSARSGAVAIANFPTLAQDQNGGLLASTAAILRYYQQIGALPQPNGLADPVGLNQFLKSSDGFISLGQSAEQTVNLWKAGGFAGGAVDVRVEEASLHNVRDLVVEGSPVLLALGSRFVVATGVAADGSVAIADPDPASGQTTLGGTAITGAVRLVPDAPSPSGFLVAGSAPVTVSAAAGVCGQALQLAAVYFRACDGAADTYQLDIAAQGPFDALFIDLSANGTRIVVANASSAIIRDGLHWKLVAVAVSIEANGVVNTASLTSDVAPGGMISIRGTAFVTAGQPTTVKINDTPAPVIAAFPFQVTAQIPLSMAPGEATVSVTSGLGSAQQSFTIQSLAPAIFSNAAGNPAIANQDNSLNSASNPGLRGGTIVIYGTGLGAVGLAGALSRTSTPVSVVIGGVEIAAGFAGLTPGSIGLYQVNVTLPQTLPPGLSLPLYLKQGSAVSNTVGVAIQ